MNNYDLVIVGGGISGLSLAAFAIENKYRTLLIEKSPRTGGSFRTHKSKDGFWIELGAHTCYNSYGNLIRLLEKYQLVQDILKREKVPYKVLKNDQLVSVISQINLLELLFNIPKAFFLKKSGQTVASYYSSVVGKRNYRKFFSKLFSAVPSQNTDGFPADILFKKRQRRKDILKSYTMKAGLSQITDTFTATSGLDVRTETEVLDIKRISTGFELLTSKNQSLNTSYLALCTPPSVASNLLAGTFSKLSNALLMIRETTIDSTGIIIPSSVSPVKPFAGIVPLDYPFYSVVSRDTVPHDNYRGFTFHFKPGVMDPQEKKLLAAKILNIRPEDILESINRQNVVPTFTPEHYSIVSTIESYIKNEPLLLSGNYFRGMSVEDCISRSLSESERMKSGT